MVSDHAKVKVEEGEIMSIKLGYRSDQIVDKNSSFGILAPGAGGVEQVNEEVD